MRATQNAPLLFFRVLSNVKIMSKKYDSPSTSVLDIIPEGILCESTKGNFEDITETNGEW